jgi:hypothetical protein
VPRSPLVQCSSSSSDTGCQPAHAYPKFMSCGTLTNTHPCLQQKLTQLR